MQIPHKFEKVVPDRDLCQIAPAVLNTRSSIDILRTANNALSQMIKANEPLTTSARNYILVIDQIICREVANGMHRRRQKRALAV